jgi:hypothetical protein
MHHLFLDLGEERWVTLYPFISIWNCSKCKWRETYYIDSWNAEKVSVDIKSFERGHLEVKPWLAVRLNEWEHAASGRACEPAIDDPACEGPN